MDRYQCLDLIGCQVFSPNCQKIMEASWGASDAPTQPLPTTPPPPHHTTTLPKNPPLTNTPPTPRTLQPPTHGKKVGP